MAGPFKCQKNLNIGNFDEGAKVTDRTLRNICHNMLSPQSDAKVNMWIDVNENYYFICLQVYVLPLSMHFNYYGAGGGESWTGLLF